MATAELWTALSIPLDLLAGLSPLSSSSPLPIGHIEIDAPAGGMTQTRPAESLQVFKHRRLDVTLSAEVGGADRYDGWRRLCEAAKDKPETAAAYQAGTLARNDDYLYARIFRFAAHSLSKPDGPWLEHCLLLRSGGMAAKVSVDLPNPAPGTDRIAASDIERTLASARLLAVPPVATGSGRDPRLTFDLPDDFIPSGLPTFAFNFKHDRLAFLINISISDPADYDRVKTFSQMSARPWREGTLARADKHIYYFVASASQPGFLLAFRTARATVQLGVDIGKAALGSGTISADDIARMLASARFDGKIAAIGQADQ